MKVSSFGFIAVMLVVIAVAMAGCTGSSPAAPATGSGSSGSAPSGGAPASGGSSQSGSGAAAAVGSLLGFDKVLEQKPYNWVEYKTVVNTEGQKMTVYYKHDMKTGTCTMRFEGEGMEGMSGMTMDCSAQGSSEAAANPNEGKSDVQFKFEGIEAVSVPAGVYPAASKYSVTSEGHTIYYWTAPGVPTFVKYSIKLDEGDMVTELNGWG